MFKELSQRKERNHTPVRSLWRTNKKQVMLAAPASIGTNGNGYIIVGGFIVGFKAAAAPVLHGAAMALFTFVAWFALNLVFGGMTTGITAWEYFGGRSLAAALLVQARAAGVWAVGPAAACATSPRARASVPPGSRRRSVLA